MRARASGDRQTGPGTMPMLCLKSPKWVSLAVTTRSAVFASTPSPGVIVWIASPTRGTELVGHGATGSEVRTLMGKQVDGSVRRNSSRNSGCQVAVRSSTMRCSAGPLSRMTSAGRRRRCALKPQLM